MRRAQREADDPLYCEPGRDSPGGYQLKRLSAPPERRQVPAVLRDGREPGPCSA